MINQNLIQWIQNQISQGYTPEQVYTYLTQQGYQANDVQETINYVMQSSQQQPITQEQETTPQEQNKPYKKPINFKLIAIITVIFIVVIGLIFAALQIIESSNISKEEEEKEDRINHVDPDRLKKLKDIDDGKTTNEPKDNSMNKTS